VLDHEEKMKKLISYGIIFILGSGAGWILSGKHWNIFFTSYVPALATLLAAFFGAKYAFQFQKDKEEVKNREKNILNGNLAIFNLVRMANTLFVYRKQFIEPFRSKPTAFLEMPPSLDLLEDDIKFNTDDLFFYYSQTKSILSENWLLKNQGFKGHLMQ